MCIRDRPPPLEGDSEDVSWALQTADALWKRGDYADAIGWVRKAANAAADAEQDLRVIALAKAAAELSALVDAFGPPPPPPEQQPSARIPSGVDIDVDVAIEPSPSPAAVKPPGPPPKKPPGPPPKRPTASPRLPTPNPVPSPLREVPFAEVASAAMIEEPYGAPPAADPIPPSHDPDSARAFPSVPPAPPDFAPTPMAMPVAKSVHPPAEPPPPHVAIASDAPRAQRTSTAPFGTPDAVARSHPALRPQRPFLPDAVTMSDEARVAAEPPRLSDNPDVVTSVRSVPPPRPSASPRLGTPLMGSVPPPRVSLAPSAPPADVEDKGVQRTVSDAPPRVAQSSAGVQIPPPPRTPSVPAPAPSPSKPPPSLGRAHTVMGFPSVPPPPKVVQAPALENAPFTGKTVLLDPEQFEVLADVPDDAREALVQKSEKVALLPEESAAAPALVIVMQGEVEVRAPGFVTQLDVISAGQVRILFPFAPADGSLQLVGGPKGARYLALGLDAIELMRASAPWVVQELEPASDDLHVVAGVLRGRHGARLDGPMLDAILGRAKTMRLAPGAKVVKQGEAVRALIFVGAGELTMRAGDESAAQVLETVDLGEVLYATELLGRRAAPSTVRAGERGALVIVATRGATEELLVTVPPLLELLGDA